MPELSLWGTFWSCVFMVGGVIVLAALVSKDEIREWWADFSREVREGF